MKHLRPESTHAAEAVSPILQQEVVRRALDGQSDSYIQSVLHEVGFSKESVIAAQRASLGFVEQQNERLSKRLDRYEQLMTIVASLQARSEKEVAVRTKPPSDVEFLDEYYFRNRPLVIRGGARVWRAVRKWSPGYLKQSFGLATVNVVTGRDSVDDPEGRMAELVKTMTLREYIDLVSDSVGNDAYMVARNHNFMKAELAGLHSDLGPLPGYIRHPPSKKRCHLWIGPSGTLTPFHFDRRNILFCQVYGRKRFILASPLSAPFIYNNYSVFSAVDPERPNYDVHPLFRRVNTLTVDLEAGDLLFLPVAWWHQVRSLSLSISVGISDFVAPNNFELAV